MDERVDFVVMADDWGGHPSSCQHLFRRIARTHRVVWVNTVGLRPPRLSRDDLVRASRKLGGWFRTRERVDRADSGDLLVQVVAPPMVPWMRPTIARTLNRFSVERALRPLASSHPVLVATVPNAVDAIDALEPRAVIYYCVDDFTRWPGIDGEAASAMESELLERADMVIATSAHLARTRSRPGLRVEHLPHGVDLEHFLTASDARTKPHPGIRRGQNVLGFVGLIDGRIDAALLAAVARTRPDWDLVLVGPVDVLDARLRHIPNLRVIDPVAYERVPSVLAAFDVAILPYARNELTRSINPLKIREYLASGKPIVATSIPEVAAFVPHVRLADDSETFCARVTELLARPDNVVRARREMLSDETWDARARTFLAWCEEVDPRTPRGTFARSAMQVQT